MSRRVYLLGVGLVLLALALAFADWTLSPWPGVTEANVKRILLGSWPTEEPVSLREEVAALLAGPKFHGAKLSWFAPQGEAKVYFRAGGRVERAERVSRPDGASKAGPIDRLRAWLGW
jgi:hypothetical protein